MNVTKSRKRKSEISSEEVKKFERLDRIVSKVAKHFVEAAAALYEIRERRLYRAKHRTFEDYCQSVHQISRQYANKLIKAGRIRLELEPIVSRLDLPMLDNEAQLRELARVSDPKDREEVLVAAVEVVAKDDPGGLTARAIRDQVDARRCTSNRAVKTGDGNQPASNTVADIAKESAVALVPRPRSATDPDPGCDEVIEKVEVVGEVGKTVSTHQDAEDDEKDQSTLPNNMFLRIWIMTTSEIRVEARGQCRADKIIELADKLEGHMRSAQAG